MDYDPLVVIISGLPSTTSYVIRNGSGKTTLAEEYLQANKNYTYLSADAIASAINPEDPVSARLEAGRKFFKRFDHLIRNDKDLLIESTLLGKSLANIFEHVRTEYDYIVTLIFIFLDSETQCIERVKARVKKGGHHVPKKDIVRRFGRSIVNFWEKYRNLSDRWMLFYNTENHFQEVAHHNGDELYVYDELLFNLFKGIKTDYE